MFSNAIQFQCWHTSIRFSLLIFWRFLLLIHVFRSKSSQNWNRTGIQSSIGLKVTFREQIFFRISFNGIKCKFLLKIGYSNNELKNLGERRKWLREIENDGQSYSMVLYPHGLNYNSWYIMWSSLNIKRKHLSTKQNVSVFKIHYTLYTMYFYKLSNEWFLWSHNIKPHFQYFDNVQENIKNL